MVNSPAAWRPTFTKAQLYKYFQYIGISEIPAQIPLKSSEQLSFLTKLTRYQICKIPFENLDLHYAPVKGVSLDTTHLFNRIVEQRVGRGGYCMQLNNFFAQILRSLGYTVITLGARVSTAVGFDQASPGIKTEEVTFKGLGHQISLVIIEGRKYFCDVGFGNAGPTFPVPLENGFSQINTGTEDQVATTVKIIKGHIPNNTGHEPEQLLWQYCIKYGRGEDESKPWLPIYCFSETEFFSYDYDVINCWISTDKKSPFVQVIVCSKFLMSEDERYIIGDITLFNEVIKERRFGKSHRVVEIKSEKDRTDALENHLGVVLGEAEKAGIMGFPTMIG